jgi:sugar phosphate isomerase/epimerase
MLQEGAAVRTAKPPREGVTRAPDAEVERMSDRSGVSRRALLGGAAVATLAAGVPTALAAPDRKRPRRRHLDLPNSNIGVQLYSVRDQQSSIGFAKLFEALAEIGYTYVEFAGYASTPSFSNKQIRRLLADNGLKPIGNHGAMDDASLEAALAIGQPYTGLSVLTDIHGPHTDGWKQTADDLNAYGEKCVKAGLKGFYIHMHGPEYTVVADDPTKRAIDVLLANTDPRYVFWEMDIYWAYFFQSYLGGGGALFDPLSWVLEAPERFPLFHVKDGYDAVKRNVGGQDLQFQSSPFGAEPTFPLHDGITDIGQGHIDFKHFFSELAKKSPLDEHYYLWERDTASDNPHGSLCSARASYLMIAHNRMAATTPY